MGQKFMRYTLLPLVITLVISLAACAIKIESVGTGPAVQWYKTFGGGKDEVGTWVQQTQDGGYIVCGNTNSYGVGGVDAWLLKTDANGNKLWSKTFGGVDYDYAQSVQQTTDGGFIFCGGTLSFGAGKQDAWLVKTDANGNKLWDKTFGDAGYDYAQSVQQTTDSGYILCGGTESQSTGYKEMWLIKTDADGNKLWEKVFNGNGAAFGTSVKQTTDGGYIACGGTMSTVASNAGYDWQEILLIKTDANGNEEWDSMVRGEKQDHGLGYYIGRSVQQTTDGGYIACGACEFAGYDVLLIKMDADGNKLWDEKYGEEDKNEDVNSVLQTIDGGYIVCGMATSRKSPISQVILLIKTDVDGNKLWEKTFGSKKASKGSVIQQTTDEGYIICGGVMRPWYGGSDLLLIKLSPDK